MALQVWLPLCKEGDFLNKGLTDITVTNNGATYDANGKIGGCYVVNLNKLTFPSLSCMEIKHGKSFSLFNWVKGTTSGLLYACNAFELRFRLDFIEIHNGPAGGNYVARYTNTFDSNIWYNLGFTWDGSEDILRLYLNGVQVAEDKNKIITNYTISSIFKISYDGPRYLNDFRIYDHCLSPKEVKEISKGLVLHYPLNEDFYLDKLSNITIYPEHLYYFTTTLKKSGTPSYCYSAIIPYDIDGKVIKNYQTQDGFKLTSKTTLSRDLNPGDTVIYCTDLSNWDTKANSYFFHVAIMGYKDSHGRLYPDYTQDSPVFGNYKDVKTNINKTNNTITLNSAFTGAQRKAGTIIYQATEGAVYYYPFWGPGNNYDDWKKHETTFYPKDINRLRYAKTVSLSSLHSTMKDTMLKDLDTYFISDCSGYCNNGTITGNLTTNDNTPRYDKCTVFNTNLTITINDTNTYITDLITVSFWIKCNLEFNSTQFDIGNFRGGIFIRKDESSYYHLVYWWLGYTDSGKVLWGGRTVPKSIQLNHWYFVTYIFNKGKFTIYLDGVSTRTEDRSTKYTKIKITSSKKIGNFDGYMSDFRIYSTALSDEDIKELYNTSAMIDNQLNLSAYSFNETSENNISKSGILNSNLFIEDSNVEIYEDKTKANQIIEI